MSAYVHNYLICNTDAKNRITSLQRDDFDDLSGYFEENVYEIDTDRYLVLFDSYGRKCCTSFIERFIGNYKSTIWYCVDEEETCQEKFWWGDNKICSMERVLYCPEGKTYIEIQYNDNLYYRPFIRYVVSSKKMVIDNILTNRCNEYTLSENNNGLSMDYLFDVCKTIHSNTQLRLPHIDKLDLSTSIYINGSSFWIDALEDGETKKITDLNDGQNMFNNIVSFINSLMEQEGIDEVLPGADNTVETIIDYLRKESFNG